MNLIQIVIQLRSIFILINWDASIERSFYHASEKLNDEIFKFDTNSDSSSNFI